MQRYFVSFVSNPSQQSNNVERQQCGYEVWPNGTAFMLSTTSMKRTALAMTQLLLYLVER